MYTLAVRLSGLPEVWREVQPFGQPLRLKTMGEAEALMDKLYPTVLQGVNHRPDVFHGLQPVQVMMVD